MTDDDAVSSEIQVDEETRAALLLFNERVASTAAEERAAKRIAKAERAKDDAAARVRTVNEDLGASSEAKAEAEAAYKAAVAELARITENPHERGRPKPRPEELATEDQPPTESPEPEPVEVSADEEPEPPASTAESE